MESSPWPENLPSNRTRAIRELIQGQDLANELRAMLRQPVKAEAGSAPLDGLVVKILETFDDTLSILSSCDSEAGSQIPPNDVRLQNSLDVWKSEDSGESVKTAPPVKNRRGGYKRRKTSETYTKITSTLVDDGHAWRKYGQKDILNEKYQRNYYRCTHKFDQGCQATKHVQMTRDDPPNYRITYHGHHTCKNLLKAPQIILDSPTSTLVSFETKGLIEKRQSHPYIPSMNHQQTQEGLSYDYQSLSSLDCYTSQDLITFGPSTPMSRTDHGNLNSPGMISSTEGTHGFDMVFNDFGEFPFEMCS